ncbi:MAG: hypothetical protein QM530_01905 [Phycisphaerales bacterium]|nr:hypothetical protein [Phycisphaerales bacterium]
MLFASISKQIENPYKEFKSDKSSENANENANEEDDTNEVEDDLVANLEYLNLKTCPDCQSLSYERIYALLNSSKAMSHYPNIIIPPPNA